MRHCAIGCFHEVYPVILSLAARIPMQYLTVPELFMCDGAQFVNAALT